MLTYTCERCGVTVKRATGDEGRGRFCSVKCGRAAQVMKPREQRFWDKVAVAGPDECWEWQGTKARAGYGRMRSGPRGASSFELAHRISLGLKLGRPLQGKALHTCDNPPCVNPAHLYEGTAFDNARDRDKRGRNGSTRLTEDDVRLIRQLRERGWPYRIIAEGLRVSPMTVADVAAGRTWKRIA